MRRQGRKGEGIGGRASAWPRRETQRSIVADQVKGAAPRAAPPQDRAVGAQEEGR